jgi:hypothetical protein
VFSSTIYQYLDIDQKLICHSQLYSFLFILYVYNILMPIKHIIVSGHSKGDINQLFTYKDLYIGLV